MLDIKRTLLLSGTAAIFVICGAGLAVAQQQPATPQQDQQPDQTPQQDQQTQQPDQQQAPPVAPGTIPIPAITVTAPRPVRRPRINVNAAQTSGPAETPSSGTLPIVADQFGTITSVPSEEIQRSGGATLGDVLNNKSGITGSSFAPGASSRPIVRGLDGNRVGMVENGTSANGASDLGEDHTVPIDPLTSDKVEVIRGPAALRYGSQAIGGVVSASSNRIPDAIPQRGVVTEFRGAAMSVDNGVDGAVIVDAGKGNFALHADAFGRTADDYRIPHSPYRFDPTRPFDGRQPNSSQRSDGESVGASYIFEQGFAGVSVSQNHALYHIPGIDGEDHHTRIDMNQTKVNGKGELRAPTAWIEAVKFWWGVTDYKHNEIGFADPADAGSDGVRQTFTNKEQEGRIEAQLMPANLGFAKLSTTIGGQIAHQALTAPSPDNPGLLNGLFDPNSNNRTAAYVFNEFKFTDATKAQIAGRIEQVNLRGSTPGFPSTLFDVANLTPSVQHDPSFAPKSISFGLIQNLPWNLVGSITAQRIERAPRPAELFSRGAHDATGTFDIGDPNLKIETAKSLEIGLRRTQGPLRFEATAYYTRFDNFIFRRLTGVDCNETSCGQGVGDEELNQAIYSQRGALFRGGEFQAQYDVARLWSGMWGVEGQYDIVRATFNDGTNVPRIPPQRLGGGVFWRDSNWLARINLLHAFAQNDIAANETNTPGYNLLRAEVSYRTVLPPSNFGPREINVGIAGNNLLNEAIRNSVSFTKDEVLLPGASVRLFANFKF
ncbi:MAG: TonB-dependent receptor [Xanthobacteraceae bacterium]